MNKKLLLEFIPLIIFLASGIGVLVKIPYTPIIAVMSGSLLAMIYFYAAFWLFADAGMPRAARIAAGVAFSITLIACIFCLMRWPQRGLYSIVSYIALGVVVIICLFNYRSEWFKPILYRCILFFVILSAIFGYRYFSA